jgi:hypothetical protein
LQNRGFKKTETRTPYSSDEKYFAYFVLGIFLIFGLAFLPALLFPMEDLEDDGAVKVFRREMRKKYYQTHNKRSNFSHSLIVNDPPISVSLSTHVVLDSKETSTPVSIAIVEKLQHPDVECGQDWAALHPGMPAVLNFTSFLNRKQRAAVWLLVDSRARGSQTRHSFSNPHARSQKIVMKVLPVVLLVSLVGPAFLEPPWAASPPNIS